MTNVRFTADGKAVGYEVILAEGSTHRYEVVIADSTEKEVSPLDFGKRRYVLSPDGTQQAFVDERDGKKDVYVVDKNESNEKRLTTVGIVDDSVLPYWDSSGHYLVFGVKDVAISKLDIVSTDGGDAKEITDYYSGGS
jgi:Tol biopolymer transport system component